MNDRRVDAMKAAIRSELSIPAWVIERMIAVIPKLLVAADDVDEARYKLALVREHCNKSDNATGVVSTSIIYAILDRS